MNTLKFYTQVKDKRCSETEQINDLIVLHPTSKNSIVEGIPMTLHLINTFSLVKLITYFLTKRMTNEELGVFHDKSPFPGKTRVIFFICPLTDRVGRLVYIILI